MPCQIFSISFKSLLLNLARAIFVNLDETPILKPPLINLIIPHLSVSFAVERRVSIVLSKSFFF